MPAHVAASVTSALFMAKRCRHDQDFGVERSDNPERGATETPWFVLDQELDARKNSHHDPA